MNIIYYRYLFIQVKSFICMALSPMHIVYDYNGLVNALTLRRFSPIWQYITMIHMIHHMRT